MTTTAQQEEAFLADVLKHPTEEWPRLIYADWLEEQGELLKAEVIRCRTGLYVTRNSPIPCEGSQFNLRVLDNTHHDAVILFTWFDIYLRHRCLQWFLEAELRMGFIERMTCTLDSWLCRHTELLHLHPVQKVRLVPGPDYDGERLRATGLVRCKKPLWGGAVRWWIEGLSDRAVKIPTEKRQELSDRDLVALLVQKTWPGIRFQLA